MTSMLVGLDVIELTSEFAGGALTQCPNCGVPLAIHQPEEQSPDRLLGTCEDCHSWFLLDLVGQTMVQLPEVGALRSSRTLSQTVVA
jgi:hypothetical protein